MAHTLMREEYIVAQQMPPIQFEYIPLEEARRMGRGPRMDPQLYEALQEKLHTLGDHATRITLPEGLNATTMKNRILRVANAINVPVTVRRVLGGLLFWRSTDEDLQQAREVASRLQAGQRSRGSRRSRRRR
jgi:hypothetical protein